jgi:hypothetical protein
MRLRHLAYVIAVTAAALTPIGAQALDDSKYPDLQGQWSRVAVPSGRYPGVQYDPHKQAGPAQQAPLTPEYQKVHEESMADQAQGGQGNFIDHARCIPGGMPSMMSGTQELIITPETTYISAGTDLRRIFTDGRPWPADAEPTYQGYSIGKWIDTAGSGTYDTLEVETRGPFKGPRAYDATGLPLAFDNESTFKELFHLDKNDPNILHNEITVFDHALTRPWSVDKTYRRNPNPYPQFARVSCMEGTNYVVVGMEVYFLSGDGFLMPTKRDQAPPDPRYFRKTSK